MVGKGSSRRDSALPSILGIMLATGISLVTFSTIIDHMMVELDIIAPVAGSLGSGYSLGMVMGMLLSSTLWKNSAHKRNLVTCALISGVSLLGFSLSQKYPTALATFTITGIANGLLLTYITTFASTFTSPEYRAKAISKVYVAYGIGILSGPFIAQTLLNLGTNWRLTLQFAGLVIILAATYAAFDGKFTSVQEGSKQDKHVPFREVIRTSSKEIWLLAMATILYEATDSSLKVWLVTFFREVHSHDEAGFVLTAMWIAIVLTRILLGELVKAEHVSRFLIGASLITTFFLIAGALSTSVHLSIIFYICVGMGYAGIYPFLLSLIPVFSTSNTDALISMITALGAIGTVISPMLTGFLCETLGFPLAMGSLAFFTLGICLILLLGFNSKAKQQGRTHVKL
jgi:predicted MFS family arabinose efflux permease